MALEYDILDILCNGQFHSGESLGQQLGVTRAAIWKAIGKLNTLDVPIQRVHGKGYRIQGGLELLDQQKIASEIDNHKLINEIQVLPTVDSTNDYLLKLARQGCKSGTFALAEHQSKGRGRLERQWYSPFAGNLFCSVLWHFNKDPAELSGLSLAVAIALVRTLENYGISGLQLKWPNDVLWQQRKLAGILLDMIAEPHGVTKVVIGIGLNIKPTEDWAYLEEITPKPIERNQLTSLLINDLASSLVIFSDQGLAPFLNDWEKRDVLNGKKIKVESSNKAYTATAKGISERGELVIDHDGQQRTILFGTVRLA